MKKDETRNSMMMMGSSSADFRQHSIPLEILDDLASRFIINMPDDLRKDIIRICFQMETAHWFYLDEYVSDEAKAASYKPKLRTCAIGDFAEHMFRHIPFLRGYADDVATIMADWREYKLTVPTYGAIILNQDLTKVLLVQSYFNKTSWGFPKGKVNEMELPHTCAVREVLEETGFNISNLIDPDQFAELVINDQTCRLFFVPGVANDTKFAPRTKCEIRDIRWYPIDCLPSSKKDPMPENPLNIGYNSLYMVMPFTRHIHKFVNMWKRGGTRKKSIVAPKKQQVKIEPGKTQQATTTNPVKIDQSFGKPDYMPKAWSHFHIKKKELFTAMNCGHVKT